MNDPGGVRLLVFQAPDLRRAAMCAAIGGQRGIESASAVSDELEVMRGAGRLLVDVALLDAGLGRARVLALCRMLKAMGLARVLVVDDGTDPAFVLDLIEAGVDGYIDRSTSLSHLVSVVRRLHAGERSIAPNLLRTMLRQMAAQSREADRQPLVVARLSRRQREVAGLLADGMTNLAIAERLAISPNTVRSHVQKVLEKLNAHSRIEAVALALDLQRVDASHAV